MCAIICKGQVLLMYQGKWTDDEKNTLREAVKNYFESRGWNEGEGVAALSARKRGQRNPHWAVIATCLPRRSVPSLAKLYQRSFFLVKKKGEWSQPEIEELKQLHGEYGDKWSLIGSLLNRPGAHVRDRWRDLVHRKEKSAKPYKIFTLEADSLLLTTIRQLCGCLLPGKGISWKNVQKRLAAAPESGEGGCSNRLANLPPCQLRMRYVRSIYPKILNYVYDGPNAQILTRHLLRYLYKRLKRGAISGESEIDWLQAVPYWPATPYQCNAIRAVIRDALAIESNKKASCFKGIVNHLYRRLDCRAYKASDSEFMVNGYKAALLFDHCAKETQRRLYVEEAQQMDDVDEMLGAFMDGINNQNEKNEVREGIMECFTSL
eukprot:GHVN01065849.1.p1 GENE.GHVN01065849.1~~GHVN01065849.1.p1  ORF type:complete len:377 (+),score=26.10 GHVN01065849.1:976-2106(+)